MALKASVLILQIKHRDHQIEYKTTSTVCGQQETQFKYIKKNRLELKRCKKDTPR